MIVTPSYIEQNVKLRDYFFRVISRGVSPARILRSRKTVNPVLMDKTLKLRDCLFHVTSNCMRRVNPPVLMDKTLKLRDCLFHVTSNCTRRVNPPVLMDKTLKLRDCLFHVHQTVRGESPASSDGQNIKAAWLFISRSSNCTRRVTRQFWSTKH